MCLKFRFLCCSSGDLDSDVGGSQDSDTSPSGDYYGQVSMGNLLIYLGAVFPGLDEAARLGKALSLQDHDKAAASAPENRNLGKVAP